MLTNVVHVVAPGVMYSIMYPVIGHPPVFAGAAHVNTMSPLVKTACGGVGDVADGAAAAKCAAIRVELNAPL